ncbi:HTTM domain-containing protein [Actinospongicola halichondriae]|uniref:HTTM domain-containing protein n=1 Tax=Actinospongicola halichondriae TaxID=3236844 RepID=UPI003D4CEF92
MDLLARLLWRPGSAVNLAVLRITLCVVLFGSAALDAISGRDSVEDLPTIAPRILGSALVVLPREQLTLRIVAALLALCCIAGALGYRTRWAMVGVLIFGAYHLGVPQIFGKVDHDHHILWIALILSLAPCGDALSIDAWGRRPAASIRYGFPLRASWLVLGLAYFFAGFWKLGSIGLDWVTAENLRGILWDERLARGSGFTPMIDIASSDPLLTAGAAFTVAFELGFVFLVFNRRTRPLAVIAGLLFHCSTGMTMGIWFTGFTIFYVAFIDWDSHLGRIETGRGAQRRRPSPPDQHRPALVAITLTGLLVFGVLAAGFGREINGWPVASYPDFGYRSSATKITAALRVDGDAAEDRVLVGLSSLERHRLLLRAASTEQGREALVALVERSPVCDGSAPTVELVTIRWRVDSAGLTLAEELPEPLVVTCS